MREHSSDVRHGRIVILGIDAPDLSAPAPDWICEPTRWPWRVVYATYHPGRACRRFRRLLDEEPGVIHAAVIGCDCHVCHVVSCDAADPILVACSLLAALTNPTCLLQSAILARPKE